MGETTVVVCKSGMSDNFSGVDILMDVAVAIPEDEL